MANSVMLVEDDTLFRTALIKFLRKAGMTVSAFANAENAAQQAQSCCPDVAVLDVSLPGMNGREFAGILRRRCPATKIVFVTGAPMGKMSGAQIMYKPVSPEALLDSIQTAQLHA
jgi:DNA-binding response OmpR family regulator